MKMITSIIYYYLRIFFRSLLLILHRGEKSRPEFKSDIKLLMRITEVSGSHLSGTVIQSGSEKLARPNYNQLFKANLS